ncbi:protein of unknown function [Shewanella benthica]|uniref:Uncharacterized protein n=1 Tax=Shewanella benthica TaxID=43661 RepID=A0A330LYA6_9GAMM|nr:protein of unknown function [Shewanella benthica]
MLIIYNFCITKYTAQIKEQQKSNKRAIKAKRYNYEVCTALKCCALS